MIYQLTSQRTVTISGQKYSQVYSYCWKGAVELQSSNELRNASAVWSNLLDNLLPSSSTASSWIYSQVLQMPDKISALPIRATACDLILTGVDRQNTNAPCSVKITTNTENLVADVVKTIQRLMNMTPPASRFLITNATIRVKEA